MNTVTTRRLPVRRIGDATVSAIGLGCLGMSYPGSAVDHRELAIRTIHRALDLGVTLIDTANVYAPTWDTIGHNEALVAEALSSYAGPADVRQVLVATKGGLTRGAGESWGRNSSREGLRAACEASLSALNVDVIDLYQQHRHDPAYTFPDQMRALGELKDAGLVRRLGLSNVTVQELEVAIDVLGGPEDGGVVSVQNEWSPCFRGDPDVLVRCTQLGIAFLPWAPLGGVKQAREDGSPYGEFARVADEVGASPHEVVIAWLLSTSPVMIPIPGATRPQTVDSIVAALSVTVSPDQCERLNATQPETVSTLADDMPRSPLT